MTASRASTPSDCSSPTGRSTLNDFLFRLRGWAFHDGQLDSFWESSLSEVLRFFPHASGGSICLLDPDTRCLEIVAAAHLPDSGRDLVLKLGEGLAGWVALQGKPLLLPEVRNDSRYVAVRPEVRTAMAVPLLDGETVMGVLNLDGDRAGGFSNEELATLTVIANEMARVATHLFRLKMLARRARWMEGLVEAGRLLVSRHDPSGIFDRLAAETRRLLECRLCAIFIYNAPDDCLRLEVLDGEPRPAGNPEIIRLHESALGTAFTHGRQVEVEDVRRTEEHHFTGFSQRLGLTSLLATPIHCEGENIGLLNVYTSRPHRFSNDERRILEALAGLAGIAVENSRLYARLFESEETLRRHERLTTLGLLAAEIAHEIRNPLTVIKLLLEGMDLRFPEDDPRTRDLAVTRDKLHQLEEIVNRVLNFGKPAAGLHSRWDLRRLVEDTLHLLRLKLSQQRIEIALAAADEPLVVDGHKGQLQQAILNLIINSCQAMPEGGRLTIHLHREVEAGQSRVVADFSDTGHGIPPTFRNRIFDSLFSGAVEGSGLGLGIVRRILASHQGGVEIRETSPQGTVMRIWLPLR